MVLSKNERRKLNRTMKKQRVTPACVLVTGVTGFLGKVVVEELMRRRSELHVDKIICLIRPKRGQGAEKRFFETTAQSPCFAQLHTGWLRRIHVVEADLSKPRCGLSDVDFAEITQHVTHIVHCAASVDFDRPVQEACTANIVSSLNMLKIAQACKKLRQMTSTSTAYVSVKSEKPLHERLEPLPRPASELYDDILRGDIPEKDLLSETGHPNTYTYTKCIAEHLLCEQRGDVPLTIVRPSIISASWTYPVPGWIDSKAAFAGFVATIGSGYLRLLNVDRETLLDLVPVDMVTARLIENTFSDRLGLTPAQQNAQKFSCDSVESVPIAYAVSGIERASKIENTYKAIVKFYRRNPVGRKASIEYAGSLNRKYLLNEWLYHKLPSQLGQSYFKLRKNDKQRRRLKRLSSTIRYINDIFPYFTHNTFDFRPSTQLWPDYEPKVYVDLVCSGVYKHLMHRDATQVPIGGSHLRTRAPDVLWGLSRTDGNFSVRSMAVLSRKILRSVFDEITFNRESFDFARNKFSKNARYVVIPTHRSYLDFLVCAYLFLARPDLGISLPYVAADPSVLSKPLVGRWMRRARAFSRGTTDDSSTFTNNVRRLFKQGRNIQFFIEGQRSRTRQFMPPKINLLQEIHNAHPEQIILLPVSISYDRVAEESPFLREMKGAARQSLSLKSLTQWAQRTFGHKVHLGRVHLSCGTPLILDEASDVEKAGMQVMQELKRHMAVSTYHLQSFLDMHPEANVDLTWLKRAIEQRGGTVIDSPLVQDGKVLASARVLDNVLERSMRNHWQHYFFADAKAIAPNNVALLHYIQANTFGEIANVQVQDIEHDQKLKHMLRTLFEPICQDYAAVAETVGALKQNDDAFTVPNILKRTTYRDYATAELGIHGLMSGDLLRLNKKSNKGFSLEQVDPEKISELIEHCDWAQQTHHEN